MSTKAASSRRARLALAARARGSRTSGLDGACPFETAGDGVLVRREEVLGIGVRMVAVFSIRSNVKIDKVINYDFNVIKAAGSGQSREWETERWWRQN